MNFKIKITFHLGLITYTSQDIIQVSPQQICMAVSLPPCIFLCFFMCAGWCIYDKDHGNEDDNGDYDDNHVVVHCPKANRWVNRGLAMKDWKGTLHILSYIYSDFIFILLSFTYNRHEEVGTYPEDTIWFKVSWFNLWEIMSAVFTA